MPLIITSSAATEALVGLNWIALKKHAHTFDSKNSMAEVLKIDSSQIIGVQVLGQLFHLKGKTTGCMLSSVCQLLFRWCTASTEDPKCSCLLGGLPAAEEGTCSTQTLCS